MVGTQTGRVALFSIHPRYAEAILAGDKKVEFRRQGLPKDVTHVVIYATAPVQRVVGVFEVEDVEEQSPQSAWRTYRKVGGIEQEAFDRYYQGTGSAYVIKVRNPKRFPTPFALTDVADTLRPPQSYMYLKDDHLARTRVLSRQSARRDARVLQVLARLVPKVLSPTER